MKRARGPRESRGWFSRLALPARIMSVVLVLALLGLAGYWVYRELSTCGPEVEQIDGQCIGVTDGSVLLAPELADVLAKIRQENERVSDLGSDVPVVSVAYLVALPPPGTAETRMIVLRNELEGAHLAQLRANQHEDARPMVRLLVANDGDDSIHWRRVIPKLIDKAAGAERLIAVVATGRTVTERENSIRELITKDIAVVSSRLTGDHLAGQGQDSGQAQGLARVPPTNSDQAAAAATYLKRYPEIRTALLIQSTEPDDTYSQSLGIAFREQFPDAEHALLTPIEEYNPALGGVAATMEAMLPNICQQRPDIIYFAGRGVHLERLMSVLPRRPCPQTPINIMGGDTAVHFANLLATTTDSELSQGLAANASLTYTTLAHPGAWEDSPESFADGAVQPFIDQCERCFHRLFPASSLDNGGAILGYDAVTIVITAVRADGTGGYDPKMVIQHFNRMHGQLAVPGASGWISLNEDKPVNKAIPILQVRPAGTVEFVELSSPLGTPCHPDNPDLC